MNQSQWPPVHNGSRQQSCLHPDLLCQSVIALQLPTRARKCLLRARINTLGDLLRLSAQDLLDLRNFGLASLVAVEARLARCGLTLRDHTISPQSNKSDA